ncbi:FAD-binding oxidoreductase [Rhodobacteraceae bacterium CCMM004]|nr:FAD-binding oxidoreductase [Rhodobacteraceae bacterium CCMM004]
MARWGRRAVLVGAGALAGGWAARAWGPSLPSRAGTVPLGDADGALVLNDASGLSPTPVASHTVLVEDAGPLLRNKLLNEIEDAAAAGQPVAVGAARHSMGGHALPPGGRAVTFDNGFVEPRQAAGTFVAHAGARWSQVIAALDPLGWSPKVMQSNNDFGVAATFCVNAHGWPAPHGPMGATVRSVRMVTAAGEWVTCSREENADLFAMTMGGYGLTGLITDLEVEMVPNRRLVPDFADVDGADLGAALAAAVRAEGVEMAYGRLDVTRARFFDRGLVIAYRPDADQDALPPAPGSRWMSHVSRHIFRAQTGNETVKRLRWAVEAGIGPFAGGGAVTRNALINEPVATLDDRDPGRTDILHEYFVPVEAFGVFVAACRAVIPASYQELLNVTLRYVDTDAESWLSYAPGPRIAAVMLFSQEMTRRAEADMARMTRALIDRVLDLGGSYYLPYRPHATQAQFVRAYPRAPEFAARKREIDPDLRFRNRFWHDYLEAL